MFETAPWLRLKLETDDEGRTIGIRMRSKLDEYRERGLSESDAKAAQELDVTSTISTLDFIGSRMAELAMVALQLHMGVRKHFDAKTTSERVGDAFGKKPS